MSLTKPAIIKREEWGAKPASPDFYPATTVAELAEIYTRAAIHHDAENASPKMTREQAMARMRSHQKLHMNQGWSDIGYHYVIAPGGEILGGRTIFARGAHAEGANTGNLGVCLMGHFEQQSPTAKQIDSLVKLLAWYCKELSIQTAEIRGHRNYTATACPGSTLYSELPSIRTRVADLIKLGGK